MKTILTLFLLFFTLSLYAQDSVRTYQGDTIATPITTKKLTFKSITTRDTIRLKCGDFFVRADTLYKIPENLWKKPGHTPLERVLWTEGAVVVYGIIDYIGYNIFKDKNIEFYRNFQGALFATINYLLQYKFGWAASVSFIMQVYSGVPDMFYYGIDGVSRGFGGFSNGNEWSKTEHFNHFSYTWNYYLCGGENRMHKADVINQICISVPVALLINW